MDKGAALQKIFPDEKNIPAEFNISSPVLQDEYLSGGKLLRFSGPSLEVHLPVCLCSGAGEPAPKLLGRHPMMGEQESLSALGAAAEAYGQGHGDWPTMKVEDRIRYIEDFAFRMKEKKREVVNLLMWEIGKSAADSEKEFDRTVAYIQDTVDALKDLDRISSRFVITQGIIGQIRRAPLGVALCMGPFNYPLNETFTTLIPALIMGNTVVIKPPKLGVLLYGPLLEAFRDSFPAGVINTVYGQGSVIITPLMASGKIDVLAFIGTSKVSDILKKAHPQPHRLRSVLGLDAKNPAIILPDADLDLTVKECVTGCLSFNGQRCTALKILFVHKKIAEPFLERLSAALENLKIGMPWEEQVAITPLAEPDKPDYLTGLIRDAENLGARVINPAGGQVNKTFFYPALLYPVSEKMRVYHEEQFGPLIPVVPFADIEKPIRYIEESNYGQQVSVFANDADLIGQLIDHLTNQVCRVNINSQCQRGPDSFPFAGRKDSAEGTLSVSDTLRVFSIRSLVAAKDADANKKIIREILRDHKSNFLSTDFIL